MKASNENYQELILPGVSRTFALTIPQLPAPLRTPVTNAYLLCRIADTIEDDPRMALEDKERFHRRFQAVVAGAEPAEPFATDLERHLAPETPSAERDLVKNSSRVIAITHSLRPQQQAALLRCIEVMCTGMREFQHQVRPDGLENMEETSRYCYCVAGVVGEMLTELFCDYCPAMQGRRNELLQLSVAFGQGLQMTNILKDVWDDRRRGACWLPRDIFLAEGVDLGDPHLAADDPAFRAALTTLLGIARENLRGALQYTLMIPPRETGVRRFCLWALGMAVLTLRKIHHSSEFTSAREVKISRNTVKATIAATNVATEHDWLLRRLFEMAAHGLPTVEGNAAAAGVGATPSKPGSPPPPSIGM